MNLDEFVQRRVESHVSDLRKLSYAPATQAVEEKKAILIEHLRDLFRLRRNAFTDAQITKLQKVATGNEISEICNRMTKAEAITRARDAEAYTAPKCSAAAEIEELEQSYQATVAENHKRFLAKQGVAFIGVRNKGKRSRETRCHLCKEDIDSELFMECQGCGWIICSCGACGCHRSKR